MNLFRRGKDEVKQGEEQLTESLLRTEERKLEEKKKNEKLVLEMSLKSPQAADTDEAEDKDEDDFFIGEPKKTKKEEKKRGRIKSDTDIPKKIPPTDLDQAVMLAIQASKTKSMVERLFIFSIGMLCLSGLFVLRLRLGHQAFGDEYTQDEEGYIFVYYKQTEDDLLSVFEGIFLILIVVTLAFRNDFPFNLAVLMGTVFFAGFVFGTVVQRGAYSSLDDDFVCESE
eukprot:snap_masked-scaffold_7-processed-gene-3.40-mRNA-1 protein AED:1.00 eAED:1.00 QI:0/-1/0/0/-1/1/1/0/226